MTDGPIVVPERGTFADVLRLLDLEHRLAVQEHGFTEEHDDRHGDQDWAWRILRRVSELMAPPTVIDQTPADRRRALLEVAHIAASAVAAHDRRAVADEAAPPDEFAGGGYVVAEGADCLFVARAENPQKAERHRYDCLDWRSGECTGCAPDPKGTE